MGDISGYGHNWRALSKLSNEREMFVRLRIARRVVNK